MPKRIQMTRQKPWRDENPDALIVARPSRWGNPFPIDEYGRELAIKLYAQALRGDWSPSLLDQGKPDSYWDETYQRHQNFRAKLGFSFDAPAFIRMMLGGRDLACWCPLDQPCHADVLLELANPTERTPE